MDKWLLVGPDATWAVGCHNHACVRIGEAPGFWGVTTWTWKDLSNLDFTIGSALTSLR